MVTVSTNCHKSVSSNVRDVSAIPAADRHVAALTGVRALAAGWVFSFHYWLAAAKPALAWANGPVTIDLTSIVAMGWFGVDVFFVLSGFVLTLQALGHSGRANTPRLGRKAYQEFVVRRILRVYPAYYACIAVLLVAPTFRQAPAPALTDVALHLGMVHNAIPAYVSTINGIFWSLPFEWQFYLVFPLLALLILRGHTAKLLLFALLMSTAVRAYVILSGNEVLLAHLPIRIDEFVVGMVAAAACARNGGMVRHAAAIFWVGLAALGFAAIYFGSRHIEWWSRDSVPIVRAWWVAGATALMLMGLAAGHHAGRRIFETRPVVWLGEISYSIYLWHLPVLLFLFFQTPWLAELRDWPVVRVALCAATVLGISATSYYLVERPFHTGLLSARAMRDRPIWLQSTTILGVAAAALMVLAVASGDDPSP